MRPPARIALIVAVVLLVAACGSTAPTPSPTQPPSAPASSIAATVLPSAAASPTTTASQAAVSPNPSASGAFNPADFSATSATVDNPWFPLTPGTTFIYKGIKDDKPIVDTFEVTHDTAVVDGVTTAVIHDTLTQGGKVAEQTVDWYAQDKAGNVWYFGEDTKALDANGQLTDTEGTWKAGVDGALPGIFMPAQPQIGLSFQQEYATAAQDHFAVLQIGVPVKVPQGSYPHALTTAEWTPLEPDVLSEKAYVQAIGEVKEFDVAGSNEKFELVSITTK